MTKEASIQVVEKLFMEDGFNNSDRVIVLASPEYKKRALIPETGVAIEVKHIEHKLSDPNFSRSLLFVHTSNNFEECIPNQFHGFFSLEFPTSYDEEQKLIEAIINN